jgi:hypothetical protein
MTNLNDNAVSVIIPDVETMTGFQCIDAANDLDRKKFKELIDSLYATGTGKVISQHIADGVADTDKMESAISDYLNSHYKVADCPDGSDLQKEYKVLTQAFRRSGLSAFPVPATDDTVATTDGELKITFKPIGSKKKDTADTRKRGVSVELVTATQQANNAAMDELKAEQAETVKKLKDEQATDLLAATTVPEIYADLLKYMGEKYGLDKQRAVVHHWLSELDNTIVDDISDISEGLSQDSIDKLTGTNG